MLKILLIRKFSTEPLINIKLRNLKVLSNALKKAQLIISEHCKKVVNTLLAKPINKLSFTLNQPVSM